MFLNSEQQAMVLSFTIFADKAAEVYHRCNPSIPILDFQQSAYLALCVAVCQYKSGAASFKTYAWRCILSAFKQLALDYGTHFRFQRTFTPVVRVSINTKVNEDGECTLDALPGLNTAADDAERTAQAHKRNEIKRAFAYLTPDQQRVLTLYFGLKGKEPLDTDVIAQRMHLTTKRVQTIKEEAINILRLHDYIFDIRY